MSRLHFIPPEAVEAPWRKLSAHFDLKERLRASIALPDARDNLARQLADRSNTLINNGRK